MTLSALVEPAYFTCPDYHQTLGPEVGELAALANFAPDPEQQLALDAMCALDKYGKSAAFEVAVIGARQNIKTGLMKIAALGKTVVMERPLFVWSAHEFRTAQESFRDLTILIESCPDLDQLVRRIYRGNGDESIEWVGGQRIIFKARTKSGGRGLTGNDVGLDEALWLTPEHMGALLPTLSAVDDPQVFYGSSAGVADSEVLRGIRDRGRAGASRRMVYIEFCAPVGGCLADNCDHHVGAIGCVLDDEAKWQMANPQMGRRISVEYIRAERQALPPLEFARERLGWWDDPAVEGAVISPADWSAVEDEESSATPQAFAVEVSLDRGRAAIGVSGCRADGHQHIELVDCRRGTDWVVPRCVELDSRHGPVTWVIDGGGPANSLIEPLEAAGLKVITMQTRDVGIACAGLVDAVAQQTVRHGPQSELADAVAGAKKRPLGDGAFAFGRKASTVDISALQAVTLALWAVTHPLADMSAVNNVW